MTPAHRRTRARALGPALTCVFACVSALYGTPLGYGEGLAYGAEAPGASVGTTTTVPSGTGTVTP
ncbi:hypothetical protein, partial [Streptomyces venezuelae]|uniref:hypothetical protein n=3 Tax=Streptomyces TaxID=1883 RepID=UPI001F25AD34